MQSWAMKIAEIFRSIQGEGKNQGYPCTFLRLAGCNLRCRWCDTPGAQSGGSTREPQEIIREIESLNGKRLCITGGEPLLQGSQLLPLVRHMKEQGFLIEIETNGTIDFRLYQPYASVCMDVKCPSSGEQSDLSLLAHVRGQDSIKFVVGTREDLQYAAGVMDHHPISGEVFFSPVEGSSSREVAEFLIARDLPARLQLQLHKIIGVP
jgi:7-carboxy-7-deazaguanine synthase